MAAVSVIVPLYNKAAHIARALDSVLAQTWQDFEIIVIDDGSTDGGGEIVKAYGDRRVRLIQQANAGPGAARNRGVKESCSEFVAFLDADDEYCPEYLERSLSNLRSHPQCVLSAVNHFRGVEKTVATTIAPFNVGIESGPWRLPPNCEAREMWGSLIFCYSCVVVCRRDVLVRYRGFYENRCTYGEDQYLWLQILLRHEIYRDTTPLFWYHTEDSALEIWARKTKTPVFPFLSDPKPIRQICPAEYRPALERMLSFAAALNRQYMVTDPDVTAFWKSYLRGAPESHDLPLDRARPKGGGGRRETIRVDMDAETTNKIRAACVVGSVTPAVYLLASLAFLVWKHSTQETLVVGCPYADKEREEIQGLFGNYISTVPVRLDVDGSLTGRHWLSYVKAQHEAAWAHNAIGQNELLELSGAARPEDFRPIYQITFALLGQDGSCGDRVAFPARLASASGDAAKDADIQVFVKDGDTFQVAVEYSAEIFEAGSMDLFATNFVRAAKALAGGAALPLEEMELMDSSARQFVEQTNLTKAPDYLGRTFLDLFREAVGAFGTSPAVKTADGTVLTYAALDSLSDGIARRLVAEGVKTGERVGIYQKRDRWLLPSLIGVFKAGAAYVPLDPKYPRDRLAAIIADAGIRTILTYSMQDAEAAALGPELHRIHVNGDSKPADQVLLAGSDPDRTAYVMFTSGSTGTPKGVPIRQGALANLLLSMRSVPGLSAQDTVLGLTTFTFDISTLEFFLPLICGAKLVLADDEMSRHNEDLVAFMQREQVTFVQATPSRWRLLLEAGWKGHPGMTLLTGGEAISTALANTLVETGASVWNMYGPTETTVWSSLTRLHCDGATPTIGRPVANTEFYVLDRANRPLPAGVPGELGIAGAGLSEGYINRPDLTARQFIEIGNNGSRRRVYKTGDLVQQRPTGDFKYLGRNDSQVKLRGFRIELREIESVMLGYQGIREAVCRMWERSPDDKRIIAYYRADSSIEESALRGHVKKRLPEFMVPGHFMYVDQFPRTSSGKTDTKALPAPRISVEVEEAKAPALTLEERMAEVWRAVLGCEDVDPHANFFDLGGHSILAVDLIHKLNARFDGHWRLADLFEHPTVAGLAQMMGSKSTTRIPLVFPVNRHVNGTPFFLLAGLASYPYHTDASHSLYEQDFLRYFANVLVNVGNVRPIYGLRPRGIYRGEHFHKSVEAMADEFIAEIKAVQPKGPYYVGGECLGGVVAHAIACRLRARGEEVAKLVLLDTHRITGVREFVMRSHDWLDEMRNKLRTVKKSWSSADFWRAKARQVVTTSLPQYFPVTKSLRERKYYNLGPLRYTRLLMRYRPQRYEGKTLLVLSEALHAKYPAVFWDSEALPDLTVHVVPGSHGTRLRLNNDVLKRALKACFE